MTTKQRKISSKERLEIYENFFHRLHFLRYVANDHDRVGKMLLIADGLINAKATHDEKGQLTAEAVEANINAALERMKVLP